MSFDPQRCVRDHWFNGEWDGILLACRDHLERAPGDREAAGLLAEMNFNLDRPDEGLRLLESLALETGDARFLNRLCAVRCGLGDLDGAIDAAAAAARADPADPFATTNREELWGLRDRIDDALARLAIREPMARGVMLIQPWGAGFWSDVQHVLGHVLAADIDGRAAHVHWAQGSAFAGNRGNDGWSAFFREAHEARRDDVDAAAKDGIFPPPWQSGSPWDRVRERRDASRAFSAVDLVGRAHALVVGSVFTNVHLVRHLLPATHALAGLDTIECLRRLAQTWLRPQPQLAARAAEFVARHFGGEPFIAAHVRGTDKHAEQGDSLAAINARIEVVVARALAGDAAARVFLMTDDLDVEEHYRSVWGDRIVCAPARRSRGAQSVHFWPDSDPRAIGEEVLVDVLIALHASEFVGNRWSNVASSVRFLRDWPAGAVRLYGTSDATCDLNASLYANH
jgi:hypothetical protein